MASNTIASASLKLTTDQAGLDQGLASSESKMKDWAKKQAKLSESAGKGINDSLKDAIKPKDDKKEDKGGGLGLGGIAGIVAGAAVAIGSAFSAIADGINKTSRSAKELGVGVLGLSALEHAAKVTRVSTDDLQGGILSLETALQQADEPAERLFSQLGLQVSKLRDLPVDEAMAQIADALKGIDDPAQAARLSLQIFGDKALGLQPLLDKGGNGIRALTDDAKRLGIAFDEVSADKVSAASEAMAKLSGIWSGFCNWLAISVSSVIEWGASALSSIDAVGHQVDGLVSDGLTALGEAWSSTWASMSETASSLGTYLSDGFATCLDAVGIDSKAAFQSINDGLGWLKDRFADLWGYVASFWDWIWSSKKGKDALKDAASSIADMAGDEGSTAGGGGSWEDKGEKDAKKFGAGFKKGLTKASMDVIKGMNDLEGELRKTLATIGMTSAESKIWELGQKGASKENLAKLKELAQAAKEVEAAWSQIEVPALDMFDRQVKGLDALLESGRLTAEQHAMGIVKATKGMMAAANLGETKTVSGMVQGSSAAVSAEIKATLQSRVTNDPAAEMKRAQAELKEIQRQQLETAKLMLAELRKDDDEWGEM